MHTLFLISLPDFTSPEVWISLLTLTFLEIVLGVDNIIFISIVANKLPQKKQKRARNIGLSLALVFRVMLLMGITWIITLTNPIFTLPVHVEGALLGISAKDLILILGGLFLLYKSTNEIHQKLEGLHEDEMKSAQKSNISAVIIQIILVDIVFSFDSILTAIGLSKELLIMIIAVIIAMVVMMQFAGAISHFINTHPTVQMLALSFLILIGVMLIAEGFHQHVDKSYIYFSIAFSLGVELLNMRLRKRHGKPVQLHGIHEDND